MKKEDLFAKLRDERDIGISALMHREKVDDRVLASIQYDFTDAPVTTNRAMLKMIGVKIFKKIPKNKLEVPQIILKIVNGLAEWNIYVVDTNHLTDDELHDRLQAILDESTPLLPPALDPYNNEGKGYAEFISLGGDTKSLPVCDRDSIFPKHETFYESTIKATL